MILGEPTSAAGKRDSRRHSTTILTENVVVAGTISIFRSSVNHFATGKGLNLNFPIKVAALTFRVEISTMKLSRLDIF